MKRVVLPPVPRGMRVVALLVAVALLLWLPLEDESEFNAVIFSIAICAWWGARWLLGVRPDTVGFFWRYLLIGTLVGLAISPVALLLMIFKSGLHSHEFLDYSPDQMQAVLLRVPLWTGGGLLVGLGTALSRKAQSR